ncbi:MAG: CHRD domain-containing protein, partial [Myxococcales bacterium]|nr:CHRD domain-containing protein [Myxococcales bacterium]
MSGNILSYNIAYSGLLGTETAAHIHTAPMGTAGPVAFPLPPSNPKIGTVTLNATQLASLIAGNLYINIHTNLFPGGEIRGQIMMQLLDNCADGNACTTNDTCANGACFGGPAANCNDGNICTSDSCDPATGCINANNTAACDDGNACTTNDACMNGACVGGAAPNCDDGDVCTDDGCDPASGCTHANNTAACDDGNACTTNDACMNGTCMGGAAP